MRARAVHVNAVADEESVVVRARERSGRPRARTAHPDTESLPWPECLMCGRMSLPGCVRWREDQAMAA